MARIRRIKFEFGERPHVDRDKLIRQGATGYENGYEEVVVRNPETGEERTLVIPRVTSIRKCFNENQD